MILGKAVSHSLVEEGLLSFIPLIRFLFLWLRSILVWGDEILGKLPKSPAEKHRRKQTKHPAYFCEIQTIWPHDGMWSILAVCWKAWPNIIRYLCAHWSLKPILSYTGWNPCEWEETKGKHWCSLKEITRESCSSCTRFCSEARLERLLCSGMYMVLELCHNCCLVDA